MIIVSLNMDNIHEMPRELMDRLKKLIMSSVI